MANAIEGGSSPSYINYDPQLGPVGQPNYGPQTGYNYPDYNAIIAALLKPYQDAYTQRIAQETAQNQGNSQLAQRQAAILQARLEAAHKQATLQINNTLGAQGLTNSGDYTYRHHVEDQQFQSQVDEAKNNLLQYLTGLANSLANDTLTGQQTLAQQQVALLPQVQQMYQPTPTYAYYTPPATPFYPGGP